MIETIEALRARVLSLRTSPGQGRPVRVAFVPTMGALHEGHIALVRRARALADVVVVSIFVNPLQFVGVEELEKYPATLAEDLEVLDVLGVDSVFVPSAREMYPDGQPTTRVTGGVVADKYEGCFRPGHFDGVLTVVAKLFAIVQPDVAVFGEKDAQQLFLVQKMVRDLSLPVEIVGCETVRDSDGLALSSRNRFLSEQERSAARVIPQALAAARATASHGSSHAISAAESILVRETLVKLDYLVIVDLQTFLPVDDDFVGVARVLVAAHVGSTRLIDNMCVDIS